MSDLSNRFTQAEALVRSATTKLVTVESSYRSSLHDQVVSVDLQVGIKEIIDGLRSALDYVAYDLAKRHGNINHSSKVYFPIAAIGAGAIDFKSLVGRNIPGLSNARPDLVDVLERFQAFTSEKNTWSPDLASLSVENKHKQLTPQKRIETETIKATTQSGTVSWNPKSVRFGFGVSIGGVPVNPATQLPVPHPAQKVIREIWVAFILESV